MALDFWVILIYNKALAERKINSMAMPTIEVQDIPRWVYKDLGPDGAEIAAAKFLKDMELYYANTEWKGED